MCRWLLVCVYCRPDMTSTIRRNLREQLENQSIVGSVVQARERSDDSAASMQKASLFDATRMRWMRMFVMSWSVYNEAGGGVMCLSCGYTGFLSVEP
jgi:hypothetical protein